MKQTATIISTYAADISGICSAMYELGGMTVMHDASGCNSTYNTHDEPRWYDMDSLVFISALSETEAILGDDKKLIDDTVTAAKELHPRFITLGGTPIPTMTGVDFPAVARQIEHKTGIPTFGLNTDGMHSYISGASKAFAVLARRMCRDDIEKTEELSINLLGATPLDFSVNGTIQAIRQSLEAQEIKVHSIWAMDTQFENIQTSAAAHVNLVISACGLKAARILQERFATPYVIGTPCGTKFTEKVIQAIRESSVDGQNRNLLKNFPDADTIIIGESVTALSLATALYEETGKGALVLCAVDTEEELLSNGCIPARDETEIIPYLEKARTVIADPMYHPICPGTVHFVELPHEGFSGRIYRDQIPQLVSGLDKFIEKGGLQL
ncbi:MAG: oxidoreductase [Lachnospiraceae bacterium]|nr:oxidoreductase [Lachnospiraceae bacterium]